MGHAEELWESVCFAASVGVVTAIGHGSDASQVVRISLKDVSYTGDATEFGCQTTATNRALELQGSMVSGRGGSCPIKRGKKARKHLR